MGELLIQLIEKLTTPELIAAVVAAVVAVAGAIRGLGELFLQIGGYGSLADKDDWFDGAGSKLKGVANAIGLVLAWCGLGNKIK